MESIIKDIPKDKVYYQDESTVIINDDCLEVMPQFADEFFDLAVTSPPYYNSAHEYQRGNRAIARERLKSMQKELCIP